VVERGREVARQVGYLPADALVKFLNGRGTAVK